MVASLEQAQQLIAAYERTMETQRQQIALQSEQIATLQEQVQVLDQALQTAKGTIERQQHQLNQALRRLYGTRSEHYHPDQLRFDNLLLQALPEATAAPEPAGLPLDEPPPTRPRRPRKHTPHGRLELPDHLERVIVELEVPEKDRICPRTGKPMVCIGYEDSPKLECRPAGLFVKVYRRAKYVSPDRQAGATVGVLTAPLPDHPIPKCKADVGLIAYAIVSKFADHLPLYRLDGILERQGVPLARSTLDGWVLSTAEALWPLGQTLTRTVLEGEVLYTDDTVMPLLEPRHGKTRKARMWVYIRGRPGPRLVTYDFSLDRTKQRPQDFLAGYVGFVHADAFGGYDELFTREGVIEVACWCHVRRRFDEAMDSRPREASDILGRIQRFYHCERELRPLPDEMRRARRQEEVRPIIEGIFDRLEQLQSQTLPSEPLRGAIDYACNQREALLRFLEDGRLDPDNNVAENAIRPLALNRKNSLFVGSPRGGRAAALYFGLIQSCKACGVDPFQYFDDVLRRVMSHSVSRLRELLPDQWQPLPRDARGLILQ
jgi:transposase